jgi:dipeptidyl aminopeptidase/acylaminoacyl peptidase
MGRVVGVQLLLAMCLFAQSLEQQTRQALDLVLSHKYRAFYDLFAPEMKKAISLETYSQQADQIMSALGTPTSIGAPSTRMVQGSPLVTIPVHWSNTSLNFLVSWNKDGKIQGTFFRPGTAEESPWSPPDYANKDAFTARAVTIGDDRWKLPGTLTVPKGKGPFPAVVLVHGSGPEDRDETVGGTKVFEDLAQGLASRGIAVLRYVKRTKQYPVVEAAPTMTAETVDDAVRAADLLRHQPDIDPQRIYVLGHSQGGYMMPRIMGRDRKLAGVIIMAGNVRPLEELIVEQTEYMASLSGANSEAERKKLEQIKQDPWSIAGKVPASYRDDLKGYNPAAEARKIDMPMLILQGERDYQVTMKDFALWHAALDSRANVTFRSYPKLNHLFVAGEGKSTPTEYEKPGHVAEDVIEEIASWVKKVK